MAQRMAIIPLPKTPQETLAKKDVDASVGILIKSMLILQAGKAISVSAIIRLP